MTPFPLFSAFFFLLPYLDLSSDNPPILANIFIISFSAISLFLCFRSYRYIMSFVCLLSILFTWLFSLFSCSCIPVVYVVAVQTELISPSHTYMQSGFSWAGHIQVHQDVSEIVCFLLQVCSCYTECYVLLCIIHTIMLAHSRCFLDNLTPKTI